MMEGFFKRQYLDVDTQLPKSRDIKIIRIKTNRTSYAGSDQRLNKVIQAGMRTAYRAVVTDLTKKDFQAD